ncbi:glutaredoxin family protein [Acidiferrobacter sp.]|uniref:glutaredoxin family protein n=1 Tax=Acidiferrobacter sp. TaxID=1872107 RepID=UPI0026220817|nr:glutaredoxin family protein [Acidiferrobacter sp.]
MTRGMMSVGVLMLMGTVAHAATLYRWVDPNGVVTYQNTPPPASAGHVRVVHVGRPPSRSAVRQAVSALHPVVLYRAPHCAPCRQVSAYLHRRKIPFRAIDVSRGRSIVRAMKRKTGSTTVPTITVGKQVLIGYIPSALKNELTAAGYPKAPGG